MIRQARRYLVGAVSSVTVVSIAIVVFVMLVSAQVFTDWPIAALGGGNEQAAVSEASPVSAGTGAAATVAKTVKPGTATTAANNGDATGGSQPGGGDHQVAAPQDNAAGAPPVSESEPGTTAPGDGSPGSTGSSPADSSSPSSSAPSQSTPSSSGSGGTASGGAGGGSKGSGGGTNPPAQVVDEVVQPVTGGGGSTTAKVTETVNETVNSVDETVTGGALQETGVTGVTEEVVNGVVGPESALGKTVDETVDAVGGLLGGNR